MGSVLYVDEITIIRISYIVNNFEDLGYRRLLLLNSCISLVEQDLI